MCSPAFTQGSAGAIPATIGDYQHFLKCQNVKKMLTRTPLCDGSFKGPVYLPAYNEI